MEPDFVPHNLPLLFDASSMIYLAKVRIMNLFFDAAECYTTEGVALELSKKKDEAWEIINSGKIRILKREGDIAGWGKLSAADLELLFFQAKGNYILVSDDGLLSEYCAKEGLYHLNALSGVCYLYYKEQLELKTAYDLLNRLSKIGRYSKKVIKYAFSLLP